MYMAKSVGDRIHPRLTPLFTLNQSVNELFTSTEQTSLYKDFIARRKFTYDNTSPNLKNSELISFYGNYCSSSIVFVTNKTPNGARKHRESTQPNSSKTAKLFFFRRATEYCVTSHAGLRTKQQHFLLSSARPHRFFTNSKSRKAHVATHLNTTASNLGCHFLYLYLHMRT